MSTHKIELLHFSQCFMQAAVDLLRQTPGEADVQPSADHRAGDLLRPAPSELARPRLSHEAVRILFAGG